MARKKEWPEEGREKWKAEEYEKLNPKLGQNNFQKGKRLLNKSPKHAYKFEK